MQKIAKAFKLQPSEIAGATLDAGTVKADGFSGPARRQGGCGLDQSPMARCRMLTLFCQWHWFPGLQPMTQPVLGAILLSTMSMMPVTVGHNPGHPKRARLISSNQRWYIIKVASSIRLLLPLR